MSSEPTTREVREAVIELRNEMAGRFDNVEGRLGRLETRIEDVERKVCA